MTREDVQVVFRAVTGNLLEKLRALPDDLPGLDEPAWQGTYLTADGPREETGWSLRQLLVHTVVASYEVPRAFCGGGSFDEVRAAGAALQGLAPSELAAALARRIDQLEELLAGLTEADLAAERQFHGRPATLGQVLLFTACHVVHHKGQIMAAMRLCGLRPGAFV